MHALAVHPLALQRCQQLGFKVEARDQRRGIGAQVIEAIALPDAAVERLGFLPRHQQAQAFQGASGVAAGGVVDGDMQLEVVGIDAEFGELVGGNQQVQRGLLVAQVVANHLGQEVFAVLPERQLQRTLQVACGVQR
ncbi:hypothetical protein D3C76_1042070 [compost metagenome]